MIELLVVVSIIVILIAILVPSLDKAMAAAQKAKCASNLSGCGKALATSLNDSLSRQYPQTPHWWGLLGNWTSTVKFTVDQRPLNRYLGYQDNTADANGAKVPLAECPSDSGDIGNGSAYGAYGSSYVTTNHATDSNRAGSHYGIQAVFGWYRSDQSNAQQPPMRAADLSPPAKKIMLSDTPIYGNRPVTTRSYRWHTSAVERRLNTLFADTHVELFLFEYTDASGVKRDAIPDGTVPDGNFYRWW